MALETATYVANLVASNPDGGDQRSTADDHLRLVKAVLLRTFPKLDGAVSLSSAQVMYLNDLSASVQSQLNTLRDGPATANFAVNARYANSASVANFIGSTPSSDVARISQQNTFTGTNQTVEAGSPSIRLKSTASPSNNQIWGWIAANATTQGRFLGRLYDDSASAVADWVGVRRTASTIDEISLVATTIKLNGTVTGTIANATEASHAASASFANAAALATLATTAISASSAALLTGLAPAELPVASTIVQRNSSAHVFAHYFNQDSPLEVVAPTDFIYTTGDGYLRRLANANVGQYLEARNITGRTGTAKTLSSSAPSGGSNGDIWYEY